MVGYVLLIAWILISYPVTKGLCIGKDIEEFQKRYAIMASIGIVIFTGLRHCIVGPDSDIYYKYLYRVHWGSDIGHMDRFEPAFQILTKIIAHFTDNCTIYFMIIAAIVMLFTGIVLYKSCKSYFCALILYMGFGNFLFQLTGLRQAIAMSICGFSILFIKKKKWIWFILMVALAAQFHKSAWLFVSLIIVGNMKPSLKTITMLVVGVIVVLVANELIVKYSNDIFGYHYTQSQETEGGWGYLAMYGCTLFGVILQRNYMLKEGKYKEINIIALNMSIITIITFLMRHWLTIAERITKYYSIGIIILLANFLSSIEDKKLRMIISAIMLVFSIIYLIQTVAIPHSPYFYKFFWEQRDIFRH